MTDEEHALLAMFVAAAQFRTRSSRDHHARQWQNALEVMDDLAESMKKATPEQRASAARIGSIGSTDKGLSHKQVRILAEKPVQAMMPSILRGVTPVLMKMNMLILTTEDPVGFITSDAPVTWFDPESYKRPPFYRSPGLGSQTVEVTMPLSPNQCLIFAWHCPNGYGEASEVALNELNRRHRALCEKRYVVRSNSRNDYWFFEPDLPDDAWEKREQERAFDDPMNDE